MCEEFVKQHIMSCTHCTLRTRMKKISRVLQSRAQTQDILDEEKLPIKTDFNCNRENCSFFSVVNIQFKSK